jgi:hypothetical protein
MTLITLSEPRLSTHRPRLPGTRHKPGWRPAAGLVRSALQNAVAQVNWRSSLTPDQVGIHVCDLVGELDSRALCVLDFALGVLVKESRRGE